MRAQISPVEQGLIGMSQTCYRLPLWLTDQHNVCEPIMRLPVDVALCGWCKSELVWEVDFNVPG